MATINAILRKETESYLQGINLANPPSPADIENDIVHRTEAEFIKVNMSLRAGQRKLSPPGALEPAQIAAIMTKL